eukprot:g2769.t1
MKTLLLSLAILNVSILFALFYNGTLNVLFHGQRKEGEWLAAEEKPPLSSTTVSRYDCSKANKLERLVTARLPFIIPAECFDWWKKAKKNDIERLEEPTSRRQRLKDMRTSKGDRVFRLHNLPQLSQGYLPYSSGWGYNGNNEDTVGYTVRNATLGGFFNFARRGRNSQLADTERSWTQCSNTIEGSMLEAELTAAGKLVQSFHIREGARLKEKLNLKGQTGSRTLLWLTSEGAVTGLHFERTHTFMVSLDGSTRWWLYPPSEWSETYSHPWLHPRYDHSQLDGMYTNEQLWRDNDTDTLFEKAFPRAQLARFVSTTISAGDVLYIPPFWSHRDEAIEDSVSLAIKSASKEEIFWKTAVWRLSLFGTKWSTPDKIVGFWTFMNRLLALLPVEDDFLSKALKEIRYRHIRGESSVTHCHKDHLIADEKLLKHFSGVAAEFANRVIEIDEATVAILLADLAEQLLSLVFDRNSFKVAEFIHKCL